MAIKKTAEKTTEKEKTVAQPTQPVPPVPPVETPAPPVPPVPPVEQPARSPLLDGLRIFKGGKLITGNPVSDNYAVRLEPGKEVLHIVRRMAELRAAFPGCEFTFFSK